jgi:hypothetical protein
MMMRFKKVPKIASGPACGTYRKCSGARALDTYTKSVLCLRQVDMASFPQRNPNAVTIILNPGNTIQKNFKLVTGFNFQLPSGLWACEALHNYLYRNPVPTTAST